MQWKRNAGKEMQEMQWKCNGNVIEMQWKCNRNVIEWKRNAIESNKKKC